MENPAPTAATTLRSYGQQTANTSPWSVGQRVRMLLWEFCWAFFCAWTPKPLNAWRVAWLKAFGATIHGQPFVHQRARIQIPWNLTLHDLSCLGDRANAYSLDRIIVGERAVIAQEAYLCTGTHGFGDRALPLRTAPIRIEEDAFVSARAFVLPGLTIGRGAVVGACAVVTRNVPPHVIVAGNPARVIRKQESSAREADSESL